MNSPTNNNNWIFNYYFGELSFIFGNLVFLFYFYGEDLLLKCQLSRRCRSYVGMGGFGKKVTHRTQLWHCWSIWCPQCFLLLNLLTTLLHSLNNNLLLNRSPILLPSSSSSLFRLSYFTNTITQHLVCPFMYSICLCLLTFTLRFRILIKKCS